MNITPQIKLDLIEVVQFIKSGHADSLNSACKQLNKHYMHMYKANKILKLIPISTANNGKTKSSIERLNHRFDNQRSKIHDSDLADVYDLYFKQFKSLAEISKHYKCTAATVLYFFRRHNLIPRTRQENFDLRRQSESYSTWVEEVRERSTQRYLEQRTHDTKPEKEFKHWLDQHNIRYAEQWRKVGNKHPYDFLIVEIDGHFWHSKEKQKIKDKQHVEFAIQKGYNIVRIDTEELRRCKGDYNLWLKIL